MSKIQIISDKNKKSSKIKILLLKKIKYSDFKKENLIIVIGGDGFMLQTLKKNKNSNKQIEVSLSDEKRYAIANVIIYD